MPTIHLETAIDAPPERCFDLSLSIDLHRNSSAQNHERAVAGVMSGVMKLGDVVTWEAIHFGVKQRLTTKITSYDRPYRFTDEMQRGAFEEITHQHEFISHPPGTLMIDVFTFRAPFGPLGRLAEMLVLTPYMKSLLLTRNQYIKQTAEAGIDAARLAQMHETRGVKDSQTQF
jgi:ligand-binding SRPBCC domain-containing protein